MVKIIIKREDCIGCGACEATCPKYFKLAEDGKSSLVGGKRNPQGNDELEVNEAGCAQSATDGCPVQVIIIEK